MFAQLSINAPTTARPVITFRSTAAARPACVARRTALKVVAKKEFVGDYVAQNKYKCLNPVAMNNLKKEWDSRKNNMGSMKGFKGFSLEETAPGIFESTQTWDSKESYEGWMDSDLKRKSHFAGDIYQYKTKDKYNVQEEFMPIITKE